jgi:hypothetical protein
VNAFPPLAVLLAIALASAAHAEDRPTMRQLPASAALPRPPSKRDLVDARAALETRFKAALFHTATAAGARTAADTLLAAAHEEPEAALKWLMLDEARRLGAASGSAEIVSRAVTLTSAVFAVDELALELESLAEIPLRPLDSARASRLAEAAERIATRAQTDGRAELAADARHLAFKAWQRAGNTAAARRVGM